MLGVLVFRTSGVSHFQRLRFGESPKRDNLRNDHFLKREISDSIENPFHFTENPIWGKSHPLVYDGFHILNLPRAAIAIRRLPGRAWVGFGTPTGSRRGT